ncbi:MAG: hypothetical protein AB8I08_27785 [Sandaracinaceae bacterium]
MSGEDQLAAGFVVGLTALIVTGIVWAKRGRTPDEMRALSQRVLRNRYPYALLGSGALIALTGVGMFAHARLTEVQVLDLSAIEAGADVDGSFVQVEGIARPDARFCRAGRRGGESCYTPIVAAPDSRHVAVLLSGEASPGAGRFSGFISRSNQLTFRRQVEEQGLHPAADLVRVIPESRTDRANAGAWVSLGGLALFSLGWAWLVRMRS